MRRYDKGGEQFYDTISALHKSVRGLTRMLPCIGWCECSTVVQTPAIWRAA